MHKRDRAILVLAFVVSRVVFFRAGVRFDASSFGEFAQFLDPVLLQTQLLKSLFYLHSQPPLFNFFLGIALKILPSDPVRILCPAFVGLGLILALSLHALLLALGASASVAVLLALLFVASPACVLYENWLFYTYFLAAALCVAAIFLNRYARTRRTRDIVVFFALLAACVLTYSVFHLAWFLLQAALLLWLLRPYRRQVLVGLCVPLLIVVGLYAKNAAVFRSFTSSTWFGMSLARMTSLRIPEAQSDALIREGRLSPMARLGAFGNVRYYRQLLPVPPPTGIDALDQRVRSTGWANYNNAIYLQVSRIYLKDALTALTIRPDIYLATVGKAFLISLEPASTYGFLRDNRIRIAGWNALYNVILYGELAAGDLMPENKEIAIEKAAMRFWAKPLFLTIGIPGLLVMGVVLVWRLARAGRLAEPRALTLAFVAGNALYVMMAGNAFEIGENNRFRFVIDPLLTALLGIAITGGLAIRRRLRGAIMDRAERLQ